MFKWDTLQWIILFILDPDQKIACNLHLSIFSVTVFLLINSRSDIIFLVKYLLIACILWSCFFTYLMICWTLLSWAANFASLFTKISRGINVDWCLLGFRQLVCSYSDIWVLKYLRSLNYFKHWEVIWRRLHQPRNQSWKFGHPFLAQITD